MPHVAASQQGERTEVIRDKLARLLEEALKAAQRSGDLPQFEIPEIIVEHPRDPAHGDYATPLCLQLAREARMAPMKIAPIVTTYFPPADFLGQVEVAPPGFINFTLSNAWLARQVDQILAAGERWGDVELGQGKRVQVEYGSANPTGPLHIGFARNVILGDTVANILEAAGHDVQREYYINDAGTQIELFGQSLYARYAEALGREVPFPEAGYQGQYVKEWGQEIAEAHGDKYLSLDYERAVEALTELGLQKVLESVRQDCEQLEIHYDNWFSERSLYSDHTYERVMQALRQGGYLYERDGAVWFAAERVGGDKDEVLIRSTGQPSYFASDIAYHYNKFVERGFEWVIDVWGADHQGHAPRMKAMMRALGLDPDRLTLLLYQLVTVKRGGEVVRLSKRTGDLITIRELLEEVGPDAMRFFLLARAADSQLDFDLDLAVERSDENPVYYVQYAHARIASILRYAEEQGVCPSGGDVGVLTHPSELALIRQMLLLPEVVEQAALDLAPHRLTYYAQELASAFHAFYRDCRVVSSDPADAELTKARLKLARAAKTVLARTLSLMGMTAPEQM